MNILLHTIALEPARWTPERVSRPLAELLPVIAGAGFYKLEIFEPHLALLPDEPVMATIMERLHLIPSVLSSYLDLSPHANPNERFLLESAALLARVDRFGFRKVRLFPGRSPTPEETGKTLRLVAERLRALAQQRPDVEFLIETHDGSLADDPANMVELVEACGQPNVGLLWQPTVFEPEAARAQWEMQKAHVRHFHLQNRHTDGTFARLETGVIPWQEFLAAVDFALDVTIEFVPSGVCPAAYFDLTASVQEAVEEFDFIVKREN